MTALNLTRERVDFEAWCADRGQSTVRDDRLDACHAEGYLNINTQCLWIGYKAGRAALAQSPVSAQPRIVLDSECLQSRCARPTSGCWGECAMKQQQASGQFAVVVLAAPVSAEGLTIPLDIAKIIDGGFLPTNPNRLRSAIPEVIAAAWFLKRAITAADKAKS